MLAHDAARAGYVRGIAARELARARAVSDLPDGFADLGHAPGGPRLAVGKLATVRVEREVPAVGQVVIPDEREAVALLAEARVLEGCLLYTSDAADE